MDLALSAVGGEVLGDDLLRNATKRPAPVSSSDRLVEQAAHEIGGEDPYVPGIDVGEEPIEEDGDGVGLFTRGAPRAPDSHPPRSPASLDDVRQDMLCEDLELGPVPVKVGLFARWRSCRHQRPGSAVTPPETASRSRRTSSRDPDRATPAASP